MTTETISLKNMTYDELCDFVVASGEKKFRAGQIFQRMYQGVTEFGEIRELPKAFRQRMEESASLSSVEMLERRVSKKDGTRKYLFSIAGGSAIESVFMKYKYGNTACISSQAGCRMGCAFCASGIPGLERDLTAGEMVDQIVAMERDTGERIGHVVVMGTGEPFDNYDELLRMVHIVHDARGLGIGLRNITVSTCGLIRRIPRFAEDLPQVNLAISLHAPNDAIRRRLMPVAKSCTMQELLETCRSYTDRTGRRITFEYALIRGVNDAPEHARELAERLHGMLCHVNLIPLNAVKEHGLSGTARAQAEEFAAILRKRHIEVTIRRELGSDIQAACGQLRLSAASSL